MIIYRCDLCGKETTNLKSTVLFKKGFDYCPECEEQANQLREKIKEIMNLRYMEYEKNVKKDEQNLLKVIDK